MRSSITVSILMILTTVPAAFAQTDGDLSVTEVRVIQVIEDPEALIAGKLATVRVGIHSTFEDRVHAKIRVRYEFGSLWFLEEGPDGVGVPLDPGDNEVYLPGGPAEPAVEEAWVPEGDGPFLLWSESGMEFQAVAVVDPFDEIPETNEQNNQGSPGTLDVRDAHALRVLFVPINFNDPDAVNWSVDDEVMEAEYEYMLSTYPISRERLIFDERTTWYCPEAPVYENPISQKMDRDWMYEHVARPIASEARIAGYDRVVICVAQEFGSLGIAIGMLREPRDPTPIFCRSHFSTFPLEGQRLEESLVAHETGHTFFLWHPHDLGPEVFWSYRHESRARVYDKAEATFMSYREEPAWIDKGRYDSDPKTWIEPGTYDFPGDWQSGIPPFEDELPVGVWTWNLLEQFTDPPPYTMTVMSVAGILDENDEVILDVPWFRIFANPDTFQPPPSPEGYWTIHLLDDQHQGITYFGFNLSRDWIAHGDFEPFFETRRADRVPFRMNVPFMEGTRYVQIRDPQDRIMAERFVSLNDPTVELTWPEGGETLAVGDSYAISWQADDTDGDALTYLVFYSRNNGASWIPLASGLTEPSFEWNTSLLPPGDSYRLRIAACDGVNLGYDVTETPLTLMRHEIAVDVKPGSCPNPVNVKGRGVLPVAICGSADFDVSTIDPDSILLRRDGAAGAVRPVRVRLVDVATPYGGDDECGCHHKRGDGVVDLAMKFRTQEVVEALDLGAAASGTASILITCRLREEFGGTPYQGEDGIKILRD